MIISVIIPTVSGPRRLAQLLASLREQVFDGPFEVIVIDDGIDQRRAVELDGLSFRTGQCECRVIHGEGKGPARARNLGVEQASGTYLLFLDDDVRVDRGYLARVSQELSARPMHAVSGMQTAIDRRNCFSLAAEWLLTVFSESEIMAGPMSKFAPSNGLALRRLDFQKCGGFDPGFPLAAGEDREFSTRWIAAGFHIIVLQEAAVEHHFPRSFPALLKQQWRYGRGTFHYQTRVDPSHAPRIRRMPFYLRMIAKPLRQYGFRRGALVAVLCALSQAVIACGYLRERVWPSVESPPRLNDERA